MNIKQTALIGGLLLLNLGISIQAQDTSTEKDLSLKQLAEQMRMKMEGLENEYKQLLQIAAGYIDTDCNKYLNAYRKSAEQFHKNLRTEKYILDKLAACCALSDIAITSMDNGNMSNSNNDDMQKIINFKKNVSSLDKKDKEKLDLHSRRLFDLQINSFLQD